MKKVEVFISGGLGNQIFQYSAGKRIAEKLGKDLVVNTTRAASSHSSFNISSFKLSAKTKRERIWFLIGRRLPIMNQIRDKWFQVNSHHLVDQKFEVNFEYLGNSRVKTISGYFQDMRYLNRLDLTELTLKSPSADYESYKSLFEKYFVIGVHVRRGDFLGQSDSHGCLSSEWYLLQIINSLEIGKLDSIIVIFTDDRDWVFKKICPVLRKNIDVKIISKEDLADPAESWDLLRSADYLICSNSTFSITAAFFSDSQVVTPCPLTRKVNFEDIESSLPEAWIRAAAIWEA